MQRAALRGHSHDTKAAPPPASVEIDDALSHVIDPHERQHLLDRLWRDACDRAELAATVAELLNIRGHQGHPKADHASATPSRPSAPAPQRRAPPQTPPSITDLLDGMLGGEAAAPRSPRVLNSSPVSNQPSS